MTDQERITALESRIAQLEGRIAFLENPRFGPLPGMPAMPPRLEMPSWPPKPYAGWKPGDVFLGITKMEKDEA